MGEAELGEDGAGGGEPEVLDQVFSQEPHRHRVEQDGPLAGEADQAPVRVQLQEFLVVEIGGAQRLALSFELEETLLHLEGLGHPGDPRRTFKMPPLFNFLLWLEGCSLDGFAGAPVNPYGSGSGSSHLIRNRGATMMTSKTYLVGGGAALLMLSLAGCGHSDAGHSTTPPVAPTVLSNTPLNGATNVAQDGSVSATFSEAMDPATITVSTFTLTSGASNLPVSGTVVYADSKVVFRPAVQLNLDGAYTATITTGAKNPAGGALAANAAWSFTTGSVATPGLPVNLGTAGGFAILAKSAISTVPTSAITGNLGVSPAAASYVTGFDLVADATNVFATSPQVTGKIYAADYAAPTSTNLTMAIGDMELAFTAAAGRVPSVTELGAGDIGGMNLAPGVYKWGTGLLIPTDVTLTGLATDVWIFQIAQDLTISTGARIVLAGGAVAKNVFWQVAGRVELGTTAHAEGVVLSQTAITLGTGASINGRLLAQTAVSIAASTVVEPTP
jgi:hypothetical protein